MSKDYLRRLNAFADRSGWTISKRPGGHLCLRHPRVPEMVITSSTPSDHRSLKNTTARCKRLQRQFGASTQEEAMARPRIENFQIERRKSVTIHTAQCSQCPATISTEVRDGSNPISAAPIADRFRNKGWRVGIKRGLDLCPDCQNKGAVRIEALKETILPKVEKPSIEMVNLEALAKRTRDQKRRIAAMLSKIYLHDAGYLPGESDETVARKCQAPKELVEIVRRDFYGPVKVMSPVAALKRELAGYRAEVQTFEREVMDRAAKLEARSLAIMRWLDKIDEKVIPEAEPLPNGHDEDDEPLPSTRVA